MNSNPKVKKKLSKKTSEMSKEVLIETLKKKKECNARALKIVEALCDSSFDLEWFMANLAFINQSHFDDVVIERSILKKCGYPLCCNNLDNIPTKKYHISTKLNKVFDITDRKNFCSNNCYKAGIYLKNQLLTSPLWFRDQESLPEFKLLPCEVSSSMGEEIVFFPERKDIKEEILFEKNSNCIQEVNEKIENINLNVNKEKDIEKNDIKVVNNVRTKVEKNQNETTFTNFNPVIDKEIHKICKNIKNKKEFFQEDERKNNFKNEFYSVLDPIKRVERSIYEWFTFDTMLYLFGEEKVKDMMKDKNEEIKTIIKTKHMTLGHSEKIDRLINFYMLLENQFKDSNFACRELKPLPDYSTVIEDGKRIEIKVKAFYKGQLEMEESETSHKSNDDEKEGNNEIYLPFVDNLKQDALRKKILLDRFNKVIPDLLRFFTTESCYDVGALRNLINHFTLSANNITFRPTEWRLIGLIIIKLLSFKNKQLESILNSKSGKEHAASFLIDYDLPQDYLENIVQQLLNPDDLIKKL